MHLGTGKDRHQICQKLAKKISILNFKMGQSHNFFVSNLAEGTISLTEAPETPKISEIVW